MTHISIDHPGKEALLSISPLYSDYWPNVYVKPSIDPARWVFGFMVDGRVCNGFNGIPWVAKYPEYIGFTVFFTVDRSSQQQMKDFLNMYKYHDGFIEKYEGFVQIEEARTVSPSICKAVMHQLRYI